MEFTLEEICDFINGGAWSDTEYADSGIHVVKVTNIVNGAIIHKDNSYLPLSKYETYKRHKLRYKDIIVATVGSHPTQPGSVVGRTASVSKEFSGSLLNQNAVCIRVRRNDLVNQTYLFYLTKTVLFKHHIESRARGSANQVRMALGELKKFRINYPPLTVQEKIAAILSAYDDLIENNKRRIALLGHMAESIYREWFVRMRFPGHDKVQFEKGVPQTWGIVELKNIARESSKSTKPGEHLSERFYVPLDLLGSKQMLPIDHLDYTMAQSSLVTFEEGDLLFGAMRPYLHKVAIAPFKGVTRTTCFVIRPKDARAYSYLFLTLFQQSSIDYASMICNGSDRPYVVWNRGMERMNVLRPDDDTLERFEFIVRPILESIKQKYFTLRNLTKTSELLLGRLISGKLPVESLNIQFPPSMLDEIEGEGTAASAKDTTHAQLHLRRRHRAGNTEEAKA
jgi:type I restriction enzyme S subunit